MKTKYIFLCAAMVAVSAGAQTQYDAFRFSDSELNGTARFVGMGGAMGALGADISVIGTNPAGIALFRGHDVSTSFSFNSTHVKSDFTGVTMKEKKNNMSFDQIGFVYSTKIGNRTNLRYLNFGFNYHKSNNLNKIFSSGGFLDGLSQTWQMANMIGGTVGALSEIDDIYNYGDVDGIQNPYNVNYPYLGVMGVRTGLVGIDAVTSKLKGWNGDRNYYNSREEGGIQQYDFNVSFNVQEKMYFGATLGVYEVDYRRTTLYEESINSQSEESGITLNHGGFYQLNNTHRTTGTGFDLKLGAIFRPIDDSAFRFGFAIHTPTWYTLTDTYNSSIYSDITYQVFDKTENAVKEEIEQINENVYDYVGGETKQDYRLTTSWKFNVNMGTVFGGIMAVGAEYEFAAHNHSKLYYYDGYAMTEMNEVINEDVKGLHTLRLGMETRIAPAFSVRAGYNFSSQAFKKTAYKALASNDMRTDVEYNNKYSQNTVTVGLGYAGRIFYVDLAYKYNLYKSDFYPFSDSSLAPARLTNERHQALMTLGVHF
ncbi:hypothetical protein [Bacteroides sp.]|uniref:hypothetical protein n=1 Tax=Bacteroides sp. TaxID=29523 RepID=UPI0025C5733E|nr:hypothetical protein [Bacteroides sp.]